MNLQFFSVTSYNVYVFSIFLGFAFILSTFVVWKYSSAEFKEEAYTDAFLYTCLLALIFSRIFYIIKNFSQFNFNFLKYVLVTQTPGLSLIGGLIGGYVFLVWYAHLRKFDLLHILDIFSIALSFALVFIKLGEQFSGAVFGRQTQFFLGINVYSLPGKYHPVEIYESLIYLTIGILLVKLYRKSKRDKWPKGFLFLLFSTFCAMTIFLLEFLKPYSVYLYGLSLKQLTALFIIIIFIYPIYKSIRYIIKS